jgi:integrase
MITREGKSVETLRRYLEGIMSFAEYMQAKTPDEALEKLLQNKDITLTLDNYVTYLQKTRMLKPVNLKAHFFGVKKWLNANRTNGVDWTYITRPKTAVTIQDRIPTRRELQIILSNRVNLRDRALFLVAPASGLRMGTLATLKLGEYQPKEELGMITVSGGAMRKLAEGRKYFTFITPEARRALEDYLATRGELGKDAPLFAGLGKTATEPLSQYVHNIGRQWRILLKRSGLVKKVENHRFNELHPHTLRKFFQTNCKLAGCRSNFIDFWMGHVSMAPQPVTDPAEAVQREYLDDSYFRAPLEVHMTEYRKAVSALTVFDSNIATQEVKAEMNDLKERLRSVEAENAGLKVQQSVVKLSVDTVDELLRRIEKLEKARSMT